MSCVCVCYKYTCLVCVCVCVCVLTYFTLGGYAPTSYADVLHVRARDDAHAAAAVAATAALPATNPQKSVPTSTT
jgi:hypothetical protein